MTSVGKYPTLPQTGNPDYQVRKCMYGYFISDEHIQATREYFLKEKNTDLPAQRDILSQSALATSIVSPLSSSVLDGDAYQ